MLNPSLPFDQTKVQLLDQLVAALCGPDASQRVAADNILKSFKAMPDSWLHTDAIIEYSANPNSKFIALSILEDAINVLVSVKSRRGGRYCRKLRDKEFARISGRR